MRQTLPIAIVTRIALLACAYSVAPATAEGAILATGSELRPAVALLKNALPMPAGGLPRQLAAPCPEDIEEINGYCWFKWSLTPGQVKIGACDQPDVYEPSAGWCRAHNAAFLPWYGRRRTNNAVGS